MKHTLLVFIPRFFKALSTKEYCYRSWMGCYSIIGLPLKTWCQYHFIDKQLGCMKREINCSN